MNPPCPVLLSADDARFLEAFESLALPAAEFRHADHLRAAWCSFRASEDFASGSARFVQNFRRYIRHLGAEAKYHETITWYYLTVVFQRCTRMPAAGWAEFRTANPDLFAPGMPLLRASYRPETLQSTLARGVFLLPDIPAA